MEQLVLILIIALISFINWLFKKSAEARERRKLERGTFDGGETLQRTEEFPPVATEAADPDDSMRRLMEALGLPQDEVPPPIPRQAPVAPVPLPPPQVFSTPAPRIAPPPFPAAKRAVKTPSLAPVVAARPRSPLRELLATPDGLKKAVMLSEILGAPKSLRP